MKPIRLELLVFVVALAVLSWNLPYVGIASGWIDPVKHFGAQDEATYTREAITMVRDGGWMTPTFLGRWVFEKPPLLMWLSAASMKAFGIGRMTARVPAVLAGAVICLLCFVMVRRERSVAAGLVAAMLALSSQILFTMSRHNMTDILLAAASVGACAVLMRDPGLRSRWSFAGFVVIVAAGIMAKSVAGILPLGVLGVLWLGNRKSGLTFGRVVTASIAVLVLASPWFVYNLVAHREWFLADTGFQIITIGRAVHQTTDENHVWFYVIRLLDSELIAVLLALSGIPALVAALRGRSPAAWIAAAYCLVYGAALMVFRFNSEQYLCWFVPSLILLAGLYSPVLQGTVLQGKGAGVAAAVVACAFAVKVANPQRDWGVSMGAGTTLAAAPVLSRYCGEHRAADLYVLGVDDEFYSAALPLQRVRYGWVDPTDLVAREHPHLAYLGILIPATEIGRLQENLPVYRQRLRDWGMDSTGAVGTGFAVRDPAELLALIRAHPESDFLVSRSILADPAKEPGHRVAFQNGEFALLEGQAAGKATAAWSCEM